MLPFCSIVLTLPTSERQLCKLEKHCRSISRATAAERSNIILIFCKLMILLHLSATGLRRDASMEMEARRLAIPRYPPKEAICDSC